MTRVDPFAVVAGRIAPGARLLRHWKLEGGVSARVDALKIARPDGSTERVVVRRHGAIDTGCNPDIARDEFRLLRVLHDAGLPVPAPRLVTSVGDPFPQPGLVVDFVEGVTEIAPPALDSALARMATCLERLHALDLGTLDLPALPRRDDPAPDILRCLPESLLGERIVAALSAHGPVTPANPPTLLHGDFWPGNILWRAGEIAAVIDWEDAAVGDPLADLAGARIELLWKHGAGAMESFTAEYLSRARLDVVNLPWWELMVASGGAKYMGAWGLDPGTEAEMRAKSAWAMENALRRITADE